MAYQYDIPASPDDVTKDYLVAAAEERGIEFASSDTKAEIHARLVALVEGESEGTADGTTEAAIEAEATVDGETESAEGAAGNADAATEAEVVTSVVTDEPALGAGPIPDVTEEVPEPVGVTKYVFEGRYYSDPYGQWLQGDVGEFTDEQAEHILRDSPGIMRPAKKKEQDERALNEPPQNRQQLPVSDRVRGR